MSEDENEADVIELDFSKKPSLTRKKIATKFCICKLFVVDEHNRTVECEYCGKIWGSFELILKWARETENAFRDLKYMKREIKKSEEKLEDIKRQERNAKARLRRLKKDITAR